VLTKVTAYSQWASIDPLVLNVINPLDTDLFEVRNIDGLGSVKADVNTTPRATPGESFSGTNVGNRNIVLTLGLNPDWNDWTFSRLRRFLDKFFMPQQKIRLVFETMEFSPVEISGYVEGNEPNLFSKDPEHQISIICPDLYFRSVDPVNISFGRSDEDPTPIEYEGNVETPIAVRIEKLFGDPGADPTNIWINIIEGALTRASQMWAPGGAPVVDATHFVQLDSTPGQKSVMKYSTGAGDPVNLLNTSSFDFGKWPVIDPGTTEVSVTSNAGIQSWTMTYFNLFGSL